MKNKSYERYKWIQRQVEIDEEYRYLMKRLRENEPAFQAAMHALSQEHRDSVVEYLGILAELSDRTTEICCEMP